MTQTVFGYEFTPHSVAFVRWQLRHKGTAPLDSVYATFWTDIDLGFGSDDLVGWDPALQMGYTYNAATPDWTYGDRPPAVGVRHLAGPSGPLAGAFNYYVGGSDPSSPAESYNLMRGLQADGNPWIDPFSAQPTRFPLAGDPVGGTGWVQTAAGDRRILVSAGPFDLAPGDSATLLFAIVVGHGHQRLDSITRLRCMADQAGDAMAAGFVPLFPSRLTLERAEARSDAVELRWSAEGVVPRPLDLRFHPGGEVEPTDWALITPLIPDGQGRLSYTDSPLRAGEVGTYGLFDPCDPLHPLSEVQFSGPGAPLAFRIASPALAGRLSLLFTLPDAGPTQLEAFDVRGRRWMDQDLGTLAHGPHVQQVGDTGTWPPGLYFLRLTHGGASRTARVVLVP